MRESNQLKFCSAFFFLFMSVNIVAATDTLSTSKFINYDLNANGFFLSSLTNKSIDPFYHASGLFNSTLTISIGKYVTVPLHAVAEVWNFSKSYGDSQNTIVWVKPALIAKIPVQAGFIDSF